MPVRQVPDDEECERINPQPGHGCVNQIREHEHEKGSQEFTKIRSSNHDLRPSGVAEIASSDCGCDCVLEVSVPVEGDGVSGQQPDKLSVCKDDLSTCPAGLEEEVKSTGNCSDVGWLAFQYKGAGISFYPILNEPPQDRGCCKEDRRDDEGEIVAKVGDEGECCSEGACCARDFIEDVNERIHSTELLDVPAYKVPRNDPANQFDHTVHHTTDADCERSAKLVRQYQYLNPCSVSEAKRMRHAAQHIALQKGPENRDVLTYRYHSISVVIAIVAEVILRMVARPERSASCSIQDEQYAAHEAENEHCASQDILGRKPLDQRRDEN